MSLQFFLSPSRVKTNPVFVFVQRHQRKHQKSVCFSLKIKIKGTRNSPFIVSSVNFGWEEV